MDDTSMDDTNYMVDDTYPVTEVLPRLTVQGDTERVPPEPKYGGVPEPVRPPSCPGLSPLIPPHHGTGTSVEGDPELSGWTQGETILGPGVVEWDIAMTECGGDPDKMKPRQEGRVIVSMPDV